MLDRHRRRESRCERGAADPAYAPNCVGARWLTESKGSLCKTDVLVGTIAPDLRWTGNQAADSTARCSSARLSLHRITTEPACTRLRQKARISKAAKIERPHHDPQAVGFRPQSFFEEAFPAGLGDASRAR